MRKMKAIKRVWTWLRSLFKSSHKKVAQAIAYNEPVRNAVEIVKKSVKKYDHRIGRLVWNSRLLGTYIRAVHGSLR